MKKLLLFIVSLVFTAALQAQIIHVPADFPTIQQAIYTANTGDTVLVFPGTYVENINFNGKNITVASLFLTTQDTAYISQTIIDGNEAGIVVTFNYYEASTALLCGFTITNGYSSDGGGGIFCRANPSLKNLIITNNSTEGNGGGITCIDFNNLFPDLIVENVLISENSSGNGGGIYCYGSNPTFKNVMIFNNIANEKGGGICFSEADPILENVTITGNTAHSGGGIFCVNSIPVFDSINRCNIYLNATATGSSGNDLVSSSFMEVIVDTFTVLYPKSYHAYPLENFSFDILNGKTPQFESDLYVSPEGDNTNSGLTPDDPLKTIQFAFSIILADSLHPHTIHLAAGTYSPSTTWESFPVKMEDYVSLSGASESDVILDAEKLSGVIEFNNNQGAGITNFTITNGNVSNGGGIYGVSNGGGIYCNGSNPLVINVTITNGNASNGGGIYCDGSNPELRNVVLANNIARGRYVVNHIFVPGSGGGIACFNSSAILQNVTITGDSAGTGGGIFASGSTILFDSISRCNIYNNTAPYGNDLYSDTFLHVIVDTFSVMYPTEYYAEPLSHFSFEILHAILPQVNADLYISPDGDNNNDGLTANAPLKNIQYAFPRIRADSLNQNTIQLLEGTYSHSATGEQFPLNIPDFLSVKGVVDSTVILDAESNSSLIQIKGNQSTHISGLTITGGEGSGVYCVNSRSYFNDVLIKNNSGQGGGIGCMNSTVNLRNVTLSDNSAWSNGHASGHPGYGGGIYCFNSNLVISETIFKDNKVQGSGNNCGGGIYCINSYLVLSETIFKDNEVGSGYAGNGYGAGIFSDTSYLKMSDVTFEDNSATFGGACYFYSHSHATIQNGIIAENSAYMGGGILMDEESQALINNVIIADNSATEFGGMGFEQQSSAILTNTIMWNNSPEEIKFSTGGVGSNEITISYSDIRGGEAGVVTNNSGIVNWLEGNINEDPLFTGSSEHPYALFDGSPCIDTGTPDTTGLNLPYVDIMGNERIWDGDGDGIAVVDMGAYEFGSIPVGMEKPAVGSQQLAVSSYPNPFHDYTTFKYELNENEAVTVSIFDHLGQMVAEPLNAYQSKGEQQCEWNPVNLPAGIYFYRIQAGKQVGSGKMVKN